MRHRRCRSEIYCASGELRETRSSDRGRRNVFCTILFGALTPGHRSCPSLDPLPLPGSRLCYSSVKTLPTASWRSPHAPHIPPPFNPSSAPATPGLTFRSLWSDRRPMRICSSGSCLQTSLRSLSVGCSSGQTWGQGLDAGASLQRCPQQRGVRGQVRGAGKEGR